MDGSLTLGAIVLMLVLTIWGLKLRRDALDFFFDGEKRRGTLKKWRRGF